jgi:O-methyltransferase involved in polyketide biosynthesis
MPVEDFKARDYASISPSALSLLLMKSHTTIAFAKEAAVLLWGDTVPSDLSHATKLENAARRVRHFEGRYRSLDTLLEQGGFPRVLELGAGLSFRGLELARTRRTFYLDTDLPAITELKARLVAELHPAPLAGTLRVRALNALDGSGFEAAVGEIPAGPIAVANEGLLVYLDDAEKAQLASNVRKTLQARGGLWLTADVYVRNKAGFAPTIGYGRSRQFLDQHRVEQNKFESWHAAEQFFNENGFRVAHKLAHRDPRHIRESWALEVAG